MGRPFLVAGTAGSARSRERVHIPWPSLSAHIRGFLIWCDSSEAGPGFCQARPQGGVTPPTGRINPALAHPVSHP